MSFDLYLTTYVVGGWSRLEVGGAQPTKPLDRALEPAGRCRVVPAEEALPRLRTRLHGRLHASNLVSSASLWYLLFIFLWLRRFGRHLCVEHLHCRNGTAAR